MKCMGWGGSSDSRACVCMCVCVCVSIYVCMHICMHVNVCMSVYEGFRHILRSQPLSRSFALSFSLFLSLSLSLSRSLSHCLHLSIFPPLSLSVIPPTLPSFTCLFLTSSAPIPSPDSVCTCIFLHVLPYICAYV